ncbi:hypothetical protein [Streptomyces sp. NPDC051219]|uniref:hypothetical protein n=1 Tax=Streptomyces sp. NPDC051219 TaxID=3155283 RepID=UPI003436720A
MHVAHYEVRVFGEQCSAGFTDGGQVATRITRCGTPAANGRQQRLRKPGRVEGLPF